MFRRQTTATPPWDRLGFSATFLLPGGSYFGDHCRNKHAIFKPQKRFDIGDLAGGTVFSEPGARQEKGEAKPRQPDGPAENGSARIESPNFWRKTRRPGSHHDHGLGQVD